MKGFCHPTARLMMVGAMNCYNYIVNGFKYRCIKAIASLQDGYLQKPMSLIPTLKRYLLNN
jgi:hypothetical protein